MENEDQNGKLSKEVEMTFFSKVKLLKETSEVSAKNLTIIVVEYFMMIICIDHLDIHYKNIDHICRIMKIWKLHLEHLGTPQQ